MRTDRPHDSDSTTTEESLVTGPLRALRSAFASCRSEIARRVNSAKQTSEREVMAIGTSVGRIVERSKSFATAIHRQRQLQAQRRNRMSMLITEVQANIRKQEEIVSQALAQSSAILQAGRDVQAMASATRLLSLNARVEASRLGDQGTSFSVIADEMRQLSLSVQRANSSVAKKATELARLLPVINEQSDRIQEGFDDVSRLVDENEGQSSNPESLELSQFVEQIVEEGYTALSHLTFQDPMAQSLERIHTNLDTVQTQIDGFGDPAVASAVEAAAPPPADSDEDVPAGELVLF